jgi:hypothetical protein
LTGDDIVCCELTKVGFSRKAVQAARTSTRRTGSERSQCTSWLAISIRVPPFVNYSMSRLKRENGVSQRQMAPQRMA